MPDAMNYSNIYADITPKSKKANDLHLFTAIIRQY